MKEVLLEEVRMFGGSAISHAFEDKCDLSAIICRGGYALIPAKGATMRKGNRYNCYVIKDGDDVAGYYGSQGGIELALRKFNFLCENETLGNVMGLTAHPDYFVLTKRSLYIFECKHIASKIKKNGTDYDTPDSQYLRQAGVCEAFNWLYQNSLAKKIGIPIVYSVFLSESFKNQTVALAYLNKKGITCFIEKANVPSLSSIGLK